MATVNKDFKVKNGLIVEGTTATVNNFDVLTKKAEDENFIIGLIGGTATSENTANTVVKRDANGDFAAGTITADLTGNADTATALETARTITLAGDVTGSVSFDGTASVSITATIDGSFATDAEVATAKGEATADASTDATTKANAAQAAAEATASADATSKANAAQAAAEATAAADATSKANAAQSAAEATASADATSKANAAQSAAEATASADATSKANAAQSAAEATASADATSKANAAQSAAEGFATQAVADLVDGAPEVLDTLNELAAALQDNPDVITDLQDIAAGKQNTLTPGANIDITSDTISVTGLDAADISDFDAAAVSATAASYDVLGAAAAAQSAAEATASADATSKANAAQSAAESTASADATAKVAAEAELRVSGDAATLASAEADATTKADAAEAAAIAHADALDTDDVAEGTAQYFTDARAKTSAADLLTGATLSNITITGSGSGLVITAENGVADSDTDDLTEGATNLYFTDARAVDALEAVVPNFTEVDINSVATQVAASIEVPTASTVTAYQFDSATYRSAKFLVKFASGTHTEVSEVLLTLDTSDNIAITEYALVGTNGNLGDVTADVNDGNVRLRVETINNNTDVTVMGTLLV